MNSFITFMNTLYLSMKVVHFIAAFIWMAGLFYLPRLFAYHAQASAGTPRAEAFERRKRRLLWMVMTPAMVVTIGLGVWMLAYRAETPGWLASSGWLHIKIVLVALLLACHAFLAKWAKDFKKGVAPQSSRFFRMVNEGPMLLVASIVILVIVQPF